MTRLTTISATQSFAILALGRLIWGTTLHTFILTPFALAFAFRTGLQHTTSCMRNLKFNWKDNYQLLLEIIVLLFRTSKDWFVQHFEELGSFEVTT